VTASGKTSAITSRICCSLLLRAALKVDSVDRRDGHVDRELDRIVGPREPLLALHLLGELRHPPLQLIWVAEQAAETLHMGSVVHRARRMLSMAASDRKVHSRAKWKTASASSRSRALSAAASRS
jgi:hypothetical protein